MKVHLVLGAQDLKLLALVEGQRVRRRGKSEQLLS
jgi:hypothetical protein